MVGPFMPRTPGRIWEQIKMGHQKELHSWDSLQSWGQLKPGTKIVRGEDLFPRRNLPEELAWSRPEVTVTGKAAAPSPKADTRQQGLITLEQLRQVDLRVARIIDAVRVPGTDKLLKVKEMCIRDRFYGSWLTAAINISMKIPPGSWPGTRNSKGGYKQLSII